MVRVGIAVGLRRDSGLIPFMGSHYVVYPAPPTPRVCSPGCTPAGLTLRWATPPGAPFAVTLDPRTLPNSATDNDEPAARVAVLRVFGDESGFAAAELGLAAPTLGELEVAHATSDGVTLRDAGGRVVGEARVVVFEWC